MRPSPYDQWGVCPILGWPRVRTCHFSPNYLSHGVFSRRISGAHGFGGGNPGGSRHLGAGARARRGPCPCPGPGAARQPDSRHDG
jgi:hypothetical protein